MPTLLRLYYQEKRPAAVYTTFDRVIVHGLEIKTLWLRSYLQLILQMLEEGGRRKERENDDENKTNLVRLSQKENIMCAIKLMFICNYLFDNRIKSINFHFAFNEEKLAHKTDRMTMSRTINKRSAPHKLFLFLSHFQFD